MCLISPVSGHLETRLLLQERKAGYLPADDDTQPLPLVVQEQADHVHGQVRRILHIYMYVRLAGTFIISFCLTSF